MKNSWIARITIATSAAALALTGCGSGSLHFQKPVTPTTATAHGEMFGGQWPVVGASLQIYEVGTAVGVSGYGSAATPLLPTPVITNSNGGFTIPDSSTFCPTPATALVYLVGTGGETGPSTVTNSNEAMMVALGPCNGILSTTHIHMNELTTVAAVWALAPFMSGTTNAYLNIGSSSTNATGIQLAFNAAQQVVDTSAGTIGSATLPAGATLPTNELNSLADILAYCVNSPGGVEGDGSNCGNLFLDAPNTAGTAYPTDTLTAAFNIAQNPARNVTDLFNKGVEPTSIFQPKLDSAPNAWTVAINYTGGGLNAPTSIAADQSGNIWVANSTAAGDSNYYISQFSNQGAAGTPISIGTAAPTGLAIDPSGNPWVTMSSANSLLEITGGTPGTPITTGLTAPTSLAIDGNGVVWVVNSTGNSVSAFDSTGNPLSGSPFSGAGISSPVSIAINGNANANCSDCK